MDTNLSNQMKYALITRRAELITYVNCESQTQYSTDNTQLFKCIATAGTLIKICETIEGEKCIVQFVEFQNNANTQLYECKTSDLLPVCENFWPYVISIANPERRLRFVRNKEQCRWVLNLQLNDILSVPGDLFETTTRFDCIIRYIGPVLELNPVGYFFGLEILQPNTCSPQINSIPFAHNYLGCEAPLSIFTTADRIAHISEEFSSKLSPRKLINDTFEKITAIVPTVLNIQNRNQGNKHNELSSNNNNRTLTVNDKDATSRSNNSQLEQNNRTLNNSSTMSNLKDKEIIVINQSDIEESTKNDNVIVINNAHEKKNMDLAELLGRNWPANAGGAAVILNGKTLENKPEKPATYPKKKEFTENRIISPVEQKPASNAANWRER